MCMGTVVDRKTLLDFPKREILKLVEDDDLGKIKGFRFSKYSARKSFCFLIHPIRAKGKWMSTGDHLHCICDSETERNKLYNAFLARFESLGFPCDDKVTVLDYVKMMDAASSI
jgi:hypothetical protein